MDRKNENRQNIERGKWNHENLKAFLDIVYDRMKKTQLEVSAFDTEIWDDIKTEMQNITGQIFDVENMKREFDYMRDYYSAEELCYTSSIRQNIEPSRWNAEKFKTFFNMLYDQIKKTGLEIENFNTETWEDIKNELQSITGQIFDVENLKRKYDYMRNYHYSAEEVRGFTSDMVMGCATKYDFQYDPAMLSEIFNYNTRKPGQVSDKERGKESAHVSNGDHIDPGTMDVDGDGRQDVDRKRKSMEPMDAVADGTKDLQVSSNVKKHKDED